MDPFRKAGRPGGRPLGGSEGDNTGLVVHGGEDLLHQVPGGQAQGGGVDTGVAAETVAFQDVLVHEKLHMVPRIVHEAKNADGAGGDVQIFFHILRTCEAKAGGADLLAEDAGFENLVPGDHQQIKSGGLAVAQQQIFADGGIEGFVNGGAGFHGIGGFVIDALVGNLEGIQQVIAADFLGESVRTVGGTAVEKGHSDGLLFIVGGGVLDAPR